MTPEAILGMVGVLGAIALFLTIVIAVRARDERNALRRDLADAGKRIQAVVDAANRNSERQSAMNKATNEAIVNLTRSINGTDERVDLLTQSMGNHTKSTAERITSLEHSREWGKGYYASQSNVRGIRQRVTALEEWREGIVQSPIQTRDAAIANDYAQGMPIDDLCGKYGLSQRTIKRILEHSAP